MQTLEHRFKFHAPPDDDTKKRHERARAICQEAATKLSGLMPDCREKSVALTKCEEAMFWANAGIARNPAPGGEAQVSEPVKQTSTA